MYKKTLGTPSHPLPVDTRQKSNFTVEVIERIPMYQPTNQPTVWSDTGCFVGHRHVGRAEPYWTWMKTGITLKSFASVPQDWNGKEDAAQLYGLHRAKGLNLIYEQQRWPCLRWLLCVSYLCSLFVCLLFETWAHFKLFVSSKSFKGRIFLSLRS